MLTSEDSLVPDVLVAAITKPYSPKALAVPEISPVAVLSLRPSGRAPEAIAKVGAGPVAVTVFE
jgi:hypothetical protein